MSNLSDTLTIPSYDSETPAVDEIPAPVVEQVDPGSDTTEQTSVVDAAPSPVLDVDAVGDHLVSLVVDGQTKTVPLTEAVSLAQKGEYFTQEMQALRKTEAEHRNAIQLAEALKRDPQGTMELLSVRLGTGTSAPATEETVYQTPEEQKIAELEAKLERVSSQIESSDNDRRLRADLDALKAKVGEFNEEELIAHAASNSTFNLEAAYAHMHLDKITKGQEALAAEAARQSVIDQKRGTQVVSRAGTAATGSLTETVDLPTHFAESYELAKNGKTVPAAQQLPDFIRQY